MSDRMKALAPRLLSALGLLAILGSTACFPITVAQFPLPGASPAPATPTEPSPRSSPTPSPAPSP